MQCIVLGGVDDGVVQVGLAHVAPILSLSTVIGELSVLKPWPGVSTL